MAKRRKWSGKAKRKVRRYRAYLDSLEGRINLMRDRGLEPYDPRPLSYRSFNELYEEVRNDRIKEKDRGERKTLGNITEKLISDQVYELSEEQAYSIFNYMKTLSDENRETINFNYKNINTAIMKIREGSFVKKDLKLWDLIKERRKELFAEGKSKTEVAQIISNDFFYPEEEEDEE